MLDDSFHVYDTTLRDGAQQEGLDLTVADKLVIARQLDGSGRRVHRGRLAGRDPEGHRVLPPRRRPNWTSSTRSSPRSARPARPALKAADDPQVAALRESRRAGRDPRRQEPRPARRARPAHHARGEPGDDRATPSRHLRGRGPAGLPGRRALLRRLPVQPGLRARGASGPPPRPAPTSSRCATPTAACCRPSSATSSTRSHRRHRGAARHPLPRRHRAAAWPTPWSRWRRASPTCRAPRTATASAPATPTCSAWWRACS